MKTLNAFKYSDLTKKSKEKAFVICLEATIKNDLEILNQDFSNNLITEEEYYNQLGCDKNYAENTSWFVPSCYYDKNKKMLDEQVKQHLEQDCLFNKKSNFIANTIL